MKNTLLTRGRLAALLAALAASLFTGCGSIPERTALFQAPQFQAAAIDRIAVLPLDLRADRTLVPKAPQNAFAVARQQLKVRHYPVDPEPVVLAEHPPLTEADLEQPAPAWMQTLPATAPRWVLVIAVLDVRRNLSFGSTGNAEVAGYLYDRASGTLVWRDKGVGQSGQGGLIGMAMIGAMANEALALACAELMTAMPIRPAAP